MVLTLVLVSLTTAALLLFVPLLRSIVFPIFALSFTELRWVFLAMEFRVLPFASTTKLVKIIRVMIESVVFVFASVRGLLPETMS